MDVSSWFYIITLLLPVVVGTWRNSEEDKRINFRRGLHSHTKRHMMPSEPRKRSTTLKPRELRKKPSGHLRPLDEDDMENDEVISVAVGPPPTRPKYDKVQWRRKMKLNQTSSNDDSLNASTNIVRNLLVQLGREFLTHQVSEDFIFGQYIGNAMKNLTSELRVKMQHNILELIVKYQKLSRGELNMDNLSEPLSSSLLPSIKDLKMDKKVVMNDENWPDFTNLDKIV